METDVIAGYMVEISCTNCKKPVTNEVQFRCPCP